MIIIVCVNTIDLVDDIIVFNLALFTFVLSITFKALPKNYIKIIRTTRWDRKNANKRVHKVRLAKENIWRRKLSPCTTQTNTELVSQKKKKYVAHVRNSQLCQSMGMQIKNVRVFNILL